MLTRTQVESLIAHILPFYEQSAGEGRTAFYDDCGDWVSVILLFPNQRLLIFSVQMAQHMEAIDVI